MTKKNFKGGINSLLGETSETQKNATPTTEKGTLPGETRATLILKKELLTKLKAVAYWDRLLIKEVVNTAMDEYISRYEKKNGEIKPIKK